jgi:hypothetical protein
VLNGAKGKYHAMTGQRNKPGRIPVRGQPAVSRSQSLFIYTSHTVPIPVWHCETELRFPGPRCLENRSYSHIAPFYENDSFLFMLFR